jgi:hypothetical protein
METFAHRRGPAHAARRLIPQDESAQEILSGETSGFSVGNESRDELDRRMAHGPGVSLFEFEAGAGHSVQQSRDKGLKASGSARAGHPIEGSTRSGESGGELVYLRDPGPRDDHAKGIQKNLPGMGNDG